MHVNSILSIKNVRKVIYSSKTMFPILSKKGTTLNVRDAYIIYKADFSHTYWWL